MLAGRVDINRTSTDNIMIIMDGEAYATTGSYLESFPHFVGPERTRPDHPAQDMEVRYGTVRERMGRAATGTGETSGTRTDR